MRDKVFVRVAFYKHVMRFNRKDKLALRFMRPFKVLERIDKVAYRLELPSSMNRIHNMFHVLLLHKYQLMHLVVRILEMRTRIEE